MCLAFYFCDIYGIFPAHFAAMRLHVCAFGGTWSRQYWHLNRPTMPTPDGGRWKTLQRARSADNWIAAVESVGAMNERTCGENQLWALTASENRLLINSKNGATAIQRTRHILSMKGVKHFSIYKTHDKIFGIFRPEYLVWIL